MIHKGLSSLELLLTVALVAVSVVQLDKAPGGSFFGRGYIVHGVTPTQRGFLSSYKYH